MLRNTCNFFQYRVMEDIRKDAGGRVSFRASEIVPLNGVYNTIYCFAFDREAEFLFDHVKKGDLVNLCCQMESFKTESEGIIRSGFKVLLCSVVDFNPVDKEKPSAKNKELPKTAGKQIAPANNTNTAEPNKAPNSHLADFAKMLEQYRK